LFARAARLEERRARLAERLEAQEAQLAELRTRVRVALARPQSEWIAFEEGNSVTDEEIELELLRRRGADGPDRVVAGGEDRCA
jgi:hypothetical protein